MTKIKQATRELIDSTRVNANIPRLFARIARLEPEQQVHAVHKLVAKMGGRFFHSREMSEWILNNRPLIWAELGSSPKPELEPDHFAALDEAMIGLNDAAQFIDDSVLQSAIWNLEEVIRNLKGTNDG